MKISRLCLQTDYNECSTMPHDQSRLVSFSDVEDGEPFYKSEIELCEKAIRIWFHFQKLSSTWSEALFDSIVYSFYFEHTDVLIISPRCDLLWNYMDQFDRKVCIWDTLHYNSVMRKIMGCSNTIRNNAFYIKNRHTMSYGVSKLKIHALVRSFSL